MREVDKGHVYALSNLKGPGETRLTFYKDEDIHGLGQTGPSTQEVLRACIARTKALDSEQPWEGNARIIEHLRMAIVEFEYRALIRRVQKGDSIEDLPTHPNGHIIP